MPFGFEMLNYCMSFSFLATTMSAVSLVANETVNIASSAGTEISWHGYHHCHWNVLTFMFWIIIEKKCTTCKFIKKSKTPETMDIKIS